MLSGAPRFSVSDRFVNQVVLDAGPYIHRGCSQLNFGRNHIKLVVHGDRHTDNQMQAAITAFFGVGNIVVFLNELKGGRTAQKRCKAIDGLRAVEHHAKAGDILKRKMRAGLCDGQVFFEQLSADGSRRNRRRALELPRSGIRTGY